MARSGYCKSSRVSRLLLPVSSDSIAPKQPAMQFAFVRRVLDIRPVADLGLALDREAEQIRVAKLPIQHYIRLCRVNHISSTGFASSNREAQRCLRSPYSRFIESTAF